MQKREIDTRDSVTIVTTNDFLKASGLEDITLKARKLLYLAIAQCKKTDQEFYEYTISVKEFAKLMDIAETHVYQEADFLTDELMKGFIKLSQPSKNKFKKFQIFELCSYNDGMILFKLSSQMSPLLLNLKRDFSKPLLNDFMKMRSNYSIEIWHLMQREMGSRKPGITDTCSFILTVEELRKITGTMDKFKQIGQFKTKVLDKAIREIRDYCGVVIEYTNIKSSRSIVAFRFVAQSLFHLDEKDISFSLRSRIEEGQKRIKQKSGLCMGLKSRSDG